MNHAKSEEPPSYTTPRAKPYTKTSADERIIAQAMAILAASFCCGPAMAKPQDVKDYLRLKLATHEHEVFAVLFLTGQHQVIEFVEMFRGTLSQASVYPREVVKAALACNAGAVILAHNHPSGHNEPSRADEHLTQALKASLALVDVRVLDHIVVSAAGCTSMAERGLI